MTLHVAGGRHVPHASDSVFPDAFRPWRAQLVRDGIHPLIAIAGSRGKSTVSGLVELMFQEAGLVCASRNDAGVTVNGAPQADESAWSRVTAGLTENVVDIAIDELNWRQIEDLAVGAPAFAVSAITNICANRDECLIQDDSKRAIASMSNLIDATARSGALILNSEDLAVIGDDLDASRTTIFVGQDEDNQVLQVHLDCGGVGAWRSGAALLAGAQGSSSTFGDLSDMGFTLNGSAAFQISNALTAIAVAASCGVPHGAIRRALRKFETPREQTAAIFHVIDARGVRVVVDRPNPSWYLRQVVRAVRDAHAPRVISLIGELKSVPVSDLPEIGRLLGRLSSVLIVHSSSIEEARINLLRQGVAQNPMPPVIVHTQNEQRAILLAMDRARRDDLVFVLADDPGLIDQVVNAERAGIPGIERDSMTAASR